MFQGSIKELQARVDDVCQRFANMAITSDLKFPYIEIDLFRDYADLKKDKEAANIRHRLDLSKAPKRFQETEIFLVNGLLVCYSKKNASQFAFNNAQALLNYTYLKTEYHFKCWLDLLGEYYIKEYRVDSCHADFYLPKHNLIVEYNGSHSIQHKRCYYFMNKGYIVCNIDKVPSSWKELLEQQYKPLTNKASQSKAKAKKKRTKKTKRAKKPDNVDKQKNEYCLDPHFLGKVKTKGDLLQCFTCNNKPLSPEDLAINNDTFYRWKSMATKKIKFTNGVPVSSELLKVFGLKSWITSLLLLKIALHKQLSIGKTRLIYKDLAKKMIYYTELFKMLSTQKALCVQMTDHILQIVYGKEAGLVLADGTPWQPQPTQHQKDSLSKAREAKETKRVFLPLPKDYFERQEESIQATNDYFADLEWERARELA